MRRRAELGSIGSGVLQSFVSRNNDLDGYWAMGKLYLYSIHAKSRTLQLDLIEGKVIPPVRTLAWWYPRPDFAWMMAEYRTMLASILERRNVPLYWLNGAVVTIGFDNAEAAPKYIRAGAQGRPYTCRLILIDDLGRNHEFRHDGWCWPHDPLAEQRRGRA